MSLTVDVNGSRPLHEQIAGAIRRAVADGSYRPGERLPPARDLAATLGVNANTVLRALRELRGEGLLEFRRGRGVRVLRRPDARAALAEAVRELLAEADRSGYGPEEVIHIIRELS